MAPRTCFLVLSFGSIAPQISELRGVKNRPFPLTKHIAYTTACSYRSSCDVYKLSRHTQNATRNSRTVRNIPHKTYYECLRQSLAIYNAASTMSALRPRRTTGSMWRKLSVSAIFVHIVTSTAYSLPISQSGRNQHALGVLLWSVTGRQRMYIVILSAYREAGKICQ